MLRRICRSLAAVAALALPVHGSGAQAANLIKNGSFESPVVPSGFVLFSSGSTIGNRWTVVGASGNVAVISGTFAQNGFTFPARTGANWLDLTGVSNSETGVQQTVPTVVGQHYNLTFFVGNISNPGGIFGTTSSVDVLIDGAQVFTAVNKRGAGTTVLTWKKFAVSFTATATQTQIAFINGDPATDTSNGLDGVVLVPVP